MSASLADVLPFCTVIDAHEASLAQKAVGRPDLFVVPPVEEDAEPAAPECPASVMLPPVEVPPLPPLPPRPEPAAIFMPSPEHAETENATASSAAAGRNGTLT